MALTQQLIAASMQKGRAAGALEVADREEKMAERKQRLKLETDRLKLMEKEGELERQQALRLQDKQQAFQATQQLNQIQSNLQNALIAAGTQGAIISEQMKPGYGPGVPTPVGQLRAPIEEAKRQGWKILDLVQRGDKQTAIFETPEGQVIEKDYSVAETTAERTRRVGGQISSQVTAAKAVLDSLETRFKEGQLNPMLQILSAASAAKEPGEAGVLLSQLGQAAPPDFVGKMNGKERNLWQRTVRKLEQLAGIPIERTFTESEIGLRPEEPFTKVQAEIQAGRDIARQPKEAGKKVAIPSGVQSRFETEQANDLVDKGAKLGKLTPNGWEVIKNGKVIGYYD